MKLTKEIIKKLILEEYNGSTTFSTEGEYIRNYKNGEKPDNNNKMPYEGKPPYEEGPVQTHIKGGEVYVTQGRNQYKLIFNDDSLTSGYLEPLGKHEFYIQSDMINWHDQTPANVRNDTDLENQIMDYSGRERK
jgi:hypothetical protein